MGVAFIDLKHPGKTPGRAYLIKQEQLKDIEICIRGAVHKNKDFILIEPTNLSDETEKCLTKLGYLVYWNYNSFDETANFGGISKRQKIISWGEEDEKNHSYRNK